MINNPAEVSHKESLPVSPLTLEQPEVIMMCQHIWCERLTASPPNRTSSGHHSPGRPPILSSSCSPSFSRLLLNWTVTERLIGEAWEVWGVFQQFMCAPTITEEKQCLNIYVHVTFLLLIVLISALNFSYWHYYKLCFQNCCTYFT